MAGDAHIIPLTRHASIGADKEVPDVKQINIEDALGFRSSLPVGRAGLRCGRGCGLRAGSFAEFGIAFAMGRGVGCSPPPRLMTGNLGGGGRRVATLGGDRCGASGVTSGEVGAGPGDGCNGGLSDGSIGSAGAG